MTRVDTLGAERPSHDDGVMLLLHRARCEFLEMPGLRLTPVQAARLWSLDYMTSERVLHSLASTGFLMRIREGPYLLYSLSSRTRLRMARPHQARVS